MVFVSFSKALSTIEIILCPLQQKTVQYIHIVDLLLLRLSQDGPFEQCGLPHPGFL